MQPAPGSPRDVRAGACPQRGWLTVDDSRRFFVSCLTHAETLRFLHGTSDTSPSDCFGCPQKSLAPPLPGSWCHRVEQPEVGSVLGHLGTAHARASVLGPAPPSAEILAWPCVYCTVLVRFVHKDSGIVTDRQKPLGSWVPQGLGSRGLTNVLPSGIMSVSDISNGDTYE
jgi:hypothetical protein